MDRRPFLLGSLVVFAALRTASAQLTGKVYRIGFLGPANASSWARYIAALREGLREFGYEEGKNLVIEYRWAEENLDRLPELASELVRLKVDLIVTDGTPGSRAAKQATTTIPVVMFRFSGGLLKLRSWTSRKILWFVSMSS